MRSDGVSAGPGPGPPSSPARAQGIATITRAWRKDNERIVLGFMAGAFLGPGDVDGDPVGRRPRNDCVPPGHAGPTRITGFSGGPYADNLNKPKIATQRMIEGRRGDGSRARRDAGPPAGTG